MIEIIDIPVPAELVHLPEIVAAQIPEIAEQMRAEILKLAHERLKSSEQDYSAGVQPVRYHAPVSSAFLVGAGTVTIASIELVGLLPNMIEQGWPGPVDMKTFLLNGRNAKITKNGVRYNTVPFRHMNPNATGRNAPPMGSQYSTMLGVMRAHQLGVDVYKAARDLNPSRARGPGGGSVIRGSTAWGGRLPAGTGGAPLLKPIHSSDIFAGMYKIVGPGGRNDTQYMTFRRVSDNSDPMKWIHPGIEARHFFREVAGKVDDIAGKVFREVISGRSGP